MIYNYTGQKSKTRRVGPKNPSLGSKDLTLDF